MINGHYLHAGAYFSPRFISSKDGYRNYNNLKLSFSDEKVPFQVEFTVTTGEIGKNRKAFFVSNSDIHKFKSGPRWYCSEKTAFQSGIIWPAVIYGKVSGQAQRWEGVDEHNMLIGCSRDLIPMFTCVCTPFPDYYKSDKEFVLPILLSTGMLLLLILAFKIYTDDE